MPVDDGRKRVVIEGVEPQVDCGRYPAKTVKGDEVVVEADAFTDGHDAITVLALYRRKGERRWNEVEMRPLVNDRWRATFTAEELGRYQFTIEAWVDHFRSWQRDMFKRVAAGQNVDVDLLIGAELAREAADRARGRRGRIEGRLLRQAAEVLEAGAGEAGHGPRATGHGAGGSGQKSAPSAGGSDDSDVSERGGPAALEDWRNGVTDCGLPSGLATTGPAVQSSHGGHGPKQMAAGVDPAAAAATDPRIEVALSAALAELMHRHVDRSRSTRWDPVLEVRVDPVKAAFSAWYEFFPRSAGPAGQHGTFEDATERLDYVQRLGFDVVYLPPIHPIGETKRKGRNNAVVAAEGDLGSPWAIGGAEGGHKAIHPLLGDEKAFKRFVKEARKRDIEIALDVAFQVSPDHPYVKEHPDWFRARPDGTIQYAENPPKKYEDIYPFDFESEDWQALWDELKSVFEHWIKRGVRIFRVDNPHTKAFPFWEWCVAELEREHPEVILLAEAFTRPKVMYRLAKLGYHQSYTYFAWRYGKHEFQEYMRELTSAPVKHFFRPNFWPNTPDILTEQLQSGGRPVFMQRLVLAATLSSSYGIYGPAFELVEARPREPGSEEYLDSEKYQLRDWGLDAEWSLAEFIARVNRIRRENPALHRNGSLRFHQVTNDMLIAYSKEGRRTGGGTAGEDSSASEGRGTRNTILTVVNLDSYHTHAGMLWLPLEELGIRPDEPFVVHDLLGGARYRWVGHNNYVELNPHVVPAHVFRIERQARTERNFDYFM